MDHLIDNKTTHKTGIVWEGSQFVYHSLAHVNRQLCIRLLNNREINLSIKPYEADQFDPKRELQQMAVLSDHINKHLSEVKVHIRHQWPPNFTPPESGAWVMMQPWEFGGIPLDWVVPMRDVVDEIWVPTNWVRDCYIASGVPGEKIKVVPLGVDFQVFNSAGTIFPLKTQKKFKFLFVGGTIYRKGIDIVLQAYMNSFSASDDVVLIIKDQSGNTYGNTNIVYQIEQIRNNFNNPPEVEYMNDPLTEVQMAELYRSCDVLVHPYRGEGFGLPIAEAMACGLAVIVTGGGAADDFINEEIGYIVAASQNVTTMQSIVPAAPGFWLLEPDINIVARAMRSAFDNPAQTLSMGQKARDHALKIFSWNRSIEIVTDRINSLDKLTPIRYQSKITSFIIDFEFLADSNLIEIITSFVAEFNSNEPVSLGFVLPNDSDQNKIDDAIDKITNILKLLSEDNLPEIILISTAKDALEIARKNSIQWINPECGSVVGLDGIIGHRFGASRLRYKKLLKTQ